MFKSFPLGPRRITSLFCSPTGVGSGNDAGDRIGLTEALILALKGSPSNAEALKGSGDDNFILLSLGVGTYTIAESINLLYFMVNGGALKLRGEGTLPSETVLEKTDGLSSPVFRALRSHLFLEALRVKNVDGTGLDAHADGYIGLSNVEIEAGYDAIAAYTGGVFELSNVYRPFPGNGFQDAYIAAYHGGQVILSDPTIDLANGADIEDGVSVASGGRVYGDATFIGAAGAGYSRWRNFNNGYIRINNRLESQLNSILPGRTIGQNFYDSDDPESPIPIEKIGGGSIPNRIIHRRARSFDIDPGEAFKFDLRRDGLTLISLGGPVAFYMVEDAQDSKGTVSGTFNAVIDTPLWDLPGTDSWFVSWSLGQLILNPPTNAFQLSWSGTGALDGTNGEVNRLNFSYVNGEMYINNRLTWPVEVSLNWSLHYAETDEI